MNASATELEEQRLDGIRWHVAAGVGRVVLDNPGRQNAIGRATSVALARAIAEVIAARPRVILLEGRGPVFCAGGDIREFGEAGDQLAALTEAILEVLLPAFLRLARAPCPVVTAVAGSVGGAGIGLALCGDFVLASETMKLRTGYAALGLSPDVGASYFLARRIGPVRAQQWLMLSESSDAARCLAAGAVDQVFAPADLAAGTQALVARLCAAAPASVAAMKRLALEGPSLALEAYLSLERELLAACARTGDAREGVAAFLSKRAPRFETR
jgi:2-(1,2-epoxy-1,2-dihydrophenyl)acetyl-CoA isomerase